MYTKWQGWGRGGGEGTSRSWCLYLIMSYVCVKRRCNLCLIFQIKLLLFTKFCTTTYEAPFQRNRRERTEGRLTIICSAMVTEICRSISYLNLSHKVPRISKMTLWIRLMYFFNFQFDRFYNRNAEKSIDLLAMDGSDPAMRIFYTKI
jgi:hypothetical protein